MRSAQNKREHRRKSINANCKSQCCSTAFVPANTTCSLPGLHPVKSVNVFLRARQSNLLLFRNLTLPRCRWDGRHRVETYMRAQPPSSRSWLGNKTCTAPAAIAQLARLLASRPTAQPNPGLHILVRIDELLCSSCNILPLKPSMIQRSIFAQHAAAALAVTV